jgi:hypothetical protein
MRLPGRAHPGSLITSDRSDFRITAGRKMLIRDGAYTIPLRVWFPPAPAWIKKP